MTASHCVSEVFQYYLSIYLIWYCIVHPDTVETRHTGCGDAGGDADLAAGAVGMAAAMEEEREAEQAARQGQQVLPHFSYIAQGQHALLLGSPAASPLGPPAASPPQRICPAWYMQHSP